MNRMALISKSTGIKLLMILLFITILSLSSCASKDSNIQTDQDLLNYLRDAYGKTDFNVSDTAVKGKYKLAAFDGSEGEIGYVFLEEIQEGAYTVVSSKMETERTHLVFQYKTEDQEQLVCVVNESGGANRVVLHVDDKEEKSFVLDKTSLGAYLFSIDTADIEEVQYEFLDASGRTIER
ncbi:hypothetical protein LI177_10365 [bacterium 210820-DFI.6.37]|nr:hypothetical protein [bacterium 210820-DFI.6.37]